jgi:hypothetical protein
MVTGEWHINCQHSMVVLIAPVIVASSTLKPSKGICFACSKKLCGSVGWSKGAEISERGKKSHKTDRLVP